MPRILYSWLKIISNKNYGHINKTGRSFLIILFFEPHSHFESLAVQLFQQALHFFDALFLGYNDLIQQRHKFRTETEPQGILRHPHGSSVMGNHFPHKIAVDAVVCACRFHLTEHLADDPVILICIAANLSWIIDARLTFRECSCHILNTFFLGGDNIQRNIL